MRKILLILLLASISFAGTIAEEFGEETAGAGLGILRSWQLLSVMALIISVILVAIAYMIGIGLEMPDIKAWAGTELVQVFANVFILMVLLVTIVFLDSLVSAIILGSGLNIPECQAAGSSCLEAVTNAYLNDYIDAAKSGARSTLMNNVDAAGNAARKLGFYCLTIFCLQLGYTFNVVGHYVLDTDMYAILFEGYTNLLNALEAQKFFINEVSFGMGPFVLALGVVARTFYFTRRLGGLLIAIAAGVMFFLPMMYVFNWLTLDMAITGDKAIEDMDIECPAECQTAPPLVYVEGVGGVESITEVYDLFTVDEADRAAELLEGTAEQYEGSNGSAVGRTVTSCYYDAKADCPAICRELPYPHTVPQCLASENQSACALLDEECKVRRVISLTDEERIEYNKCPDSCKVVPPLKSDCETGMGDCITSRYDCRVYQRSGDDIVWWPQPPEDIGNYGACIDAQDCVVSTDAYESCSYIIPAYGRCEDICPGCPAHCRVEGGNPANMDTECIDEGTGEIVEACSSCPDSCLVNISQIEALAPAEEGLCEFCPEERRLVGPALPANYTTGACSAELCPSEYRGQLPRSTCEACFDTEEAYSYSPPIQTACSDLCKPPDNIPVKEAGSYMKIGEDGLVGREEIKSLSKLMIPGYLLPLFNIVATLVFIKGLSTILGGDIEIPGISRVF